MVGPALHTEPNLVLQLRAQLEWIRNSALRKIILVTHSRGGGTEQHCQEIADHFSGKAIFLVLRPRKGGVTCLQLNNGTEVLELYFSLPKDLSRLFEILRFCNLSFVHFHHLLGHHDSIWNIADELGIPHYFTAHDYFPYCPRLTLTGFDDRYCGESGEHGSECCNSVSNRSRSHILEWRLRSSALLNSAKFVFAPSLDTAKRYRRYFPLANVVYVEHFDNKGKLIASPNMPTVSSDQDFRIAILGKLSKLKGADLLEQTATESLRRNPNLSFKLFGFPYRHLAETRNLSIHGPYLAPELESMLTEWSPHVVWFPAQCPETYGYTLSACLRLGLPVVVPDIGALQERIVGRSFSWIVPWRSTAIEMIDFFNALQRDGSTISNTPACADVPQSEFDYERDYLGSSTKGFTEVELPISWELACEPPQRVDWVPDRVKDSMLDAANKLRYSLWGAKLLIRIPQQWRHEVSLWLANDS